MTYEVYFSIKQENIERVHIQFLKFHFNNTRKYDYYINNKIIQIIRNKIPLLSMMQSFRR